MDTDQIIEYWAAYMRAEHCTDRTIKERGIFIRSLIRHTGAQSPLHITKPQLVMFLGRDGLTGKTKQNYRSALHTFFTWLQDEELRLDNPANKLPKPRVEHTEPNPTTTDDIQTVLNSGIYGRTRMMVLLYAYQGLRASEIAAVSGANIDWARKRIFTVDGKGRKEVWRPLHTMILDHCNEFPKDSHWFPGEFGHIRGKSVSATLSAAFRRAGIQHTGHHMRAWYATTQLEAGVDPLVVQYGMRHSDMQSIKRYDLPSHERISRGQETLPRVVVPISSGRRVRAITAPMAA